MKRNLAIVALIQTLFLGGMVAAKQYTLSTGEQILLQTEPIDPRSLFRGDYVRLNYSINTLNPRVLAGDDTFERHDWVYVVLEPTGVYHSPVAVHHAKPEPEAGQVVIKGRVAYRMRADNAGNGPLRLSYGIENYFVPEGTGRELELRWTDEQDKRVDIRVAVDAAGNAGIKAVLVNGEERYVETLL